MGDAYYYRVKEDVLAEKNLLMNVKIPSRWS